MNRLLSCSNINKNLFPKTFYLKNSIFHFSSNQVVERVNFKVFFDSTDKLVEVEANVGDKFLNVIQKYEFPEMGLCGGNISCATCHIIVPNSLYPLLNEQSFEEEELLSSQSNNEDHSRLGCQTIITKDFEDVTIKIPKPIEDNTKI